MLHNSLSALSVQGLLNFQKTSAHVILKAKKGTKNAPLGLDQEKRFIPQHCSRSRIFKYKILVSQPQVSHRVERFNSYKEK